MKKIEEYSINELKVIAYDELVKLEMAQNNIAILNKRIAELSKTPEIKEEKTKKE